MPKTIDGLMRHLREAKGIHIYGSPQKLKLRNIGYYHGYKGYRFIKKATNQISYKDFAEITAIYNFDMKLKTLLYPQLMFIETAVKNYALEIVLSESRSESFNDIYVELLTDYKRYNANSSKYKDALKRRLKLRDHIYAALTNKYDKKAVIQHFYHKDKNVPIWAIFEIITLGEFANFLTCLKMDARVKISKSVGLYQPADTNGFLLKDIILLIKDLRNAVAHNDVIFDTRFVEANPPTAIVSNLEIETKIKDIKFSSITDYFVLIIYLLKLFGVSKVDLIKVISEFENSIEQLRSSIPINIYNQIIYTDVRNKIAGLRAYVKIK